MKALNVNKLKTIAELDEVVIESLEQALYRMTVVYEGETFYVTEGDKSFTRRNLLQMQEVLVGKKINAMYLEQASSYDEMIGMDTQSGTNRMRVPIGMPEHLLH